MVEFVGVLALIVSVFGAAIAVLGAAGSDETGAWRAWS